ncbi:MAG: DUF2480 family protein [Saprospiraceae bacterium]|nr:DUF2480 family protein [Lewinella sp.]
MSTDSKLVNRVAASGLITIDLTDYLPKTEVAVFDLKDYLFRELILREKDFREAVKVHDWPAYEGKTLLVYCSSDAIIPMWAYMLVATHAAPYATDVFQGDQKTYVHHYLYQKLANLDLDTFTDQRIVIKGCGDQPVPPGAYLEITRLLQPVAKSIMYGEPCSTVPIYKKR